MRTSLKAVVATLDARAEREWAKLVELEQTHSEYRTESQNEGVVEQRARWAAWDAAADIANGKGITSFETEQRSA